MDNFMCGMPSLTMRPRRTVRGTGGDHNDEQNAPRHDGLLSLPLELILILSMYMSRATIADCLKVSKGWRLRFSAHQIMDAAISRFFPPLSIPRSDQEALDRCAVFEAAARKSRNREQGNWSLRIGGSLGMDSWYFKLDPTFHPENGNKGIERCLDIYGQDVARMTTIFPWRTFYADGKIASWATRHGDGVVAVDDLRTGTRKIYKANSPRAAAAIVEVRAFGNKLCFIDEDLFG